MVRDTTVLKSYFKGKTCKVTVKHEEYNGNTNARVKAWEVSDFQGCSHVFKNDDSSPSFDNIPGFYPVDDDDIPF